MVKFASGFLNRRALKRALKEVEFEDLMQEKFSNASFVPVREYKTEKEQEPQKKIKVNSALSKPQTEAVDLKHFKDWRTINKVESKNPLYVPKKKVGLFDDDDEGEQPSIESPVLVNKTNLVSKIEEISKASDSIEKNEEKKDTSISSFFKEKYKANETLRSSETKTETKIETKTESKTNQLVSNANKKTSLNDLLKKQPPKENKPIEQPKENVVKVEVVDFSEKKEENNKVEPKKEGVKKPTNRKPRGKNKRRFDADVISSVDWK